MKVIFLDHDGVICLILEWGTRFNKGREGLDSEFDDFYPDAIKVLNQIIEETGCEIVVSSDWRRYVNLEQMQELYRMRGIVKSPVGMTGIAQMTSFRPKLDNMRCIEIKEYLQEHPEITKWVAVDDMDLSSLGNFVHTTNPGLGIAEDGIKEKIIEFLT